MRVEKESKRRINGGRKMKTTGKEIIRKIKLPIQCAGSFVRSFIRLSFVRSFVYSFCVNVCVFRNRMYVAVYVCRCVRIL